MIFDILEKLEMYIPMEPKLKVVADSMDHDEIYDKGVGKYKTYDPDVTYEVREITTTNAETPFCVHKNTTVVSIVLSGHELASTTWRELKDQVPVFDAKTDTGLFTAEPISALQASQGRFLMFFPGEPYKTGVSTGESEKIKKVVFCIKTV